MYPDAGFLPSHRVPPSLHVTILKPAWTEVFGLWTPQVRLYEAGHGEDRGLFTPRLDDFFHELLHTFVAEASANSPGFSDHRVVFRYEFQFSRNL